MHMDMIIWVILSRYANGLGGLLHEMHNQAIDMPDM